MTIVSEIRQDYNSFLTVFILFLYGLANIVAFEGLVQIGMMALVVLVIFPSIIRHIYCLNKKMILIFLGFNIIFIFQIFIYPHNLEGIMATIISFWSIGLVGLYCGSLPFKINRVLYFGYKLAYINLFVNLIYIALARADIDTLSMRFGYGILPSALFFLLNYFLNGKKISLGLFFIIFCLIFIWGSRGCLLVIMLFATFYFFKKYRFKALLGFGIILLFSGIIISNLSNLIDILPFESYKLRKMSMTLNQGLVAASSGRDVLYAFYWNKFIENIWGLGIGCQYLFNVNYPHNIFIQVAVEFGVIGLIILCIYIIEIYRIIHKQTLLLYYFLILIFSITFGRLIISSNFWDRPEFWFLLSMVFTNPTLKYR